VETVARLTRLQVPTLQAGCRRQAQAGFTRKCNPTKKQQCNRRGAGEKRGMKLEANEGTLVG
jgi:hypothetical protein